MPDTRKYEGKDFEKIMEKAAKDFKTTRDNLEYQIVQKRERKGLFVRHWIVKVRLDRNVDPRYNDGEFKIEEKEGDIYLTVTAPGIRGKVVTYEEVASELKKYELEVEDKFKIKNILEQATGEPFVISKYVKKAKVDGGFYFQVDEDNLKAYLKVDLPEGRGEKVDYKEVVDYINELGILEKYVDYETLEEVIENSSNGEYVQVAAARMPENGKDAEIKYYFSRKKKYPVKDEEGTISHYEVKDVNQVRNGELIAEKFPAKEGINGEDLLGNLIEASDGQESELIPGKNVRLEKTEDKIYAEINGQGIVDEEGKINVLPVYTLEKSLDQSTGNLDLISGVIIKGDVREGMEIRAEGDVEVYGIASACYIESGGDVLIQKGIVGENKAEIICKGNLFCKFVENSSVYADNDLHVADMIYHSHAEAENVYCHEGKKGLITGSKVVAGKEVQVKNLGGELGGETQVLLLGISPVLKREHDRLKENIEKTENYLEELKDESKREYFKELLKMFKIDLQTIEDRMQTEKYYRPKLIIEEKAAPGSLVKIDNNILKFEEEKSKLVLKESKNKDKIESEAF